MTNARQKYQHERWCLHPGIKLLMFILFATSASAFGLYASLGCVAVIGGMLVWVKKMRSALAMLWRLKWLFIVLFAMHGYYTPGPAAWPSLAAWSPSEPGLLLASRRILMLVVLVMAATWLLATTETGRLATGIAWVLRPLSLVGLSTEQVALRLTLALQQAPRLIEGLKQDNSKAPAPAVKQSRINALAQRCATAIRQAENQPPITLHLPPRQALRLLDIAVFITLATIVWGLAQL